MGKPRDFGAMLGPVTTRTQNFTGSPREEKNNHDVTLKDTTSNWEWSKTCSKKLHALGKEDELPFEKADVLYLYTCVYI